MKPQSVTRPVGTLKKGAYQPRESQRTPSVIIFLAMVDERELQLIISAEGQFRQI